MKRFTYDTIAYSDDVLQELVDLVGADRIMVGSDYCFDIAYDDGTPTEFAECFDPAWGAMGRRLKPSPGNHEYHTAGAAGYFGYFGAAAGDPLNDPVTKKIFRRANYATVVGQNPGDLAVAISHSKKPA